MCIRQVLNLQFRLVVLNKLPATQHGSPYGTTHAFGTKKAPDWLVGFPLRTCDWPVRKSRRWRTGNSHSHSPPPCDDHKPGRAHILSHSVRSAPTELDPGHKTQSGENCAHDGRWVAPVFIHSHRKLEKRAVLGCRYTAKYHWYLAKNKHTQTNRKKIYVKAKAQLCHKLSNEQK